MPLDQGAHSSDRVGTLAKWVAPFFWAERNRLLTVILLSMMALGMSLLQPLLTKAIIDDGIIGRKESILLWAGGGILVLTICSPIVGFLTRRVYVYASSIVLHRMRERMFLKILTLDQDTLSRFHHGDILTRLESDLSEIQRFALDSVLSAINAFVLLLGTFVILGYMNPYLSFGSILAFMAMSYLLGMLRPRLEKLSKAARECGVQISSFLVERVHGIKHIQNYGATSRELDSLRKLHRTARERTLDLQVVGYAATAIPGFVLSLAISILFIGGGLLIIRGADVTLGVLVAFTTYIQRISGPIQSVSGLFVGWQRAKVSLVRVMEIASHGDEEPLGPGANAVLTGRPGGVEISIRDLSYNYPGTLAPVFRDVNLCVRAGEIIHLRAPSGFGKSTLVDLLHGHRKATGGGIWIDGKRLDQIAPGILRKMIVVVGHDPVMFSGTMESNIRYGAPDAVEDRVAFVTEAVGLNQMLLEGQRDLQTQVGVRGCNLSVGEKQRIALARALLIKPQVLIIDEATSGLDTELEALVLRNLTAFFRDMTCIVISHRELPAAWFDCVESLVNLEARTDPLRTQRNMQYATALEI